MHRRNNLDTKIDGKGKDIKDISVRTFKNVEKNYIIEQERKEGKNIAVKT